MIARGFGHQEDLWGKKTPHNVEDYLSGHMI